jgi:hypothetical protein
VWAGAHLQLAAADSLRVGEARQRLRQQARLALLQPLCDGDEQRRVAAKRCNTELGKVLNRVR